MTLGQKIKELREKKGWIQDELADKVKVSKQQISNYEQDIYIPRKKKLEAIAAALEISAVELSSLTYTVDNKEDVRGSDSSIMAIVKLQGEYIELTKENAGLKMQVKALKKEIKRLKGNDGDSQAASN